MREERRGEESRGDPDTTKVVGLVDESDVYDGNMPFIQTRSSTTTTP
jgi:hypothetical protein